MVCDMYGFWGWRIRHPGPMWSPFLLARQLLTGSTAGIIHLPLAVRADARDGIHLSTIYVPRADCAEKRGETAIARPPLRPRPPAPRPGRPPAGVEHVQLRSHGAAAAGAGLARAPEQRCSSARTRLCSCLSKGLQLVPCIAYETGL